jgi:hypothetical protein
MKYCPTCREPLHLLNLMLICEKCGFYVLVGKRKSRIKVQNWVDYLIHKKK